MLKGEILMQAIMETAFDVVYLCTVITLGMTMVRKGKTTNTIYALAIVRIVLCLLPQNEWLNYNAPVSWGVYRNIPFAIMGLMIIYLFYKEAKAHQDSTFKWMWLAIVLSFAFYIPVVLWATTFRLIGMLMIPKTLAYVWVVWMGYQSFKQESK